MWGTYNMKEQFLAELKIYQDKIIEAVQDYFLIERFADWDEYKHKEIAEYNSTFIPISNSLKLSFVTRYTALFDKRSNYRINKIVKPCKGEDWFMDSCVDGIVESIVKITEEDNDAIKNAMVWRDKFLVHFDAESINEEEFLKLKGNTPLLVDDMLKNLHALHNYINNIRIALGKRPRKMFSLNYQTIDNMMIKLLSVEVAPVPKFDLKKIID